MKKVFNSILASSLILSLGAVSFAAEIPSTATEVLQEIETKTLSSMSPEVASAYAGVIEGIVSKYGEKKGDYIFLNSDTTEISIGLMVAKLVDFDGDGTDELYVAYATKQDELEANIREEVWDYGTSLQKVYSDDTTHYYWTSSMQNYCTYLLSSHDGTYLMTTESGASNASQYYDATIRGYKNGQFSTLETIGYHCSNFEGTGKYTLNGVTTTEKATLDDWPFFETELFLAKSSYLHLENDESYILGGNWEFQNCLPQLQAIASQPSTKTATPSTAKVMVNGKVVDFGAYNIDGFHFYKLTDMSYALNGTGKQFEVTWDGTASAINMKIGSPHIVLGSELQGTSGGDKVAEEMDVKVLKNSALVNDLIVYSIDGSSYFQLDKLKGVLGIAVGWDGDTGTITITT